MTIPSERTRAVQRVSEFLRGLLKHGKPKEPAAEFRSKVRYLLKHFPNDFDLKQSHKKLPSVWGKPDGSSEGGYVE